MGRDLILRPYGRFHYLPKLLAAMGHDVTVLLLNHARGPKESVIRDGVKIISVSFVPTGPIKYLLTAHHLVSENKPDWIIGLSDTFYGILSQYLADRYGIRCLIDAYDNYESYLPWCFPLHFLWRRALGKATRITAAGPQLAELLRDSADDREVSVLPMAADPKFIPIDRIEARNFFGLPLRKKIIGYCGAIYKNRDIELLFSLAEHLKTSSPDFEIVISGRKEKGVNVPGCTTWLGYLPDEQVPKMLNSMDVLLVLNRESKFGKYSYPVKLYEAMQCLLPVVASDTEAIRWILRDREKCLAKPGDVEDFTNKIIEIADVNRCEYEGSHAWGKVASELETILSE